MDNIQFCKDIDKQMDELYIKCLNRISNNLSVKLMYGKFYWMGKSIGTDFYLYPFEKAVYKHDIMELDGLDDNYEKIKSVLNLDKKINTKEELDSNFDRIYNKYLN